MLLRDIFKFTKPSLDAFCPFGLISSACQGPTGPPIALTLTFINQINAKQRLTCRLLLNKVRCDILLAAWPWTKTDILSKADHTGNDLAYKGLPKVTS